MTGSVRVYQHELVHRVSDPGVVVPVVIGDSSEPEREARTRPTLNRIKRVNSIVPANVSAPYAAVVIEHQACRESSSSKAYDWNRQFEVASRHHWPQSCVFKRG